MLYKYVDSVSNTLRAMGQRREELRRLCCTPSHIKGLILCIMVLQQLQ